jgi:GTP-binding protein HflX
VGVGWGDTSQEEAEESLQELRSLAETAGAYVIDSLLQMRQKPDPATLMGKGKLDELTDMAKEGQADLVIFDQELSPSQQRNLENKLDIKVIDRTALILDIFAIHAHSKEGKTQVEMAQLRYALTRLAGRGTELSRLLGGIGIRGPGETKLEVDRRRINTRIKTLDRELKNLSRVRKTKRKRRDRMSVPTFSLIGYTNAGKSSLLNVLTGAEVAVEDQLFSTLDPVTRQIVLPGNRRAVITDTVGFINHLPHQLVEAFKSTLEEVKEADVLLHVVDSSVHNIQRKIAAVDEVLEEIGASDMPTLYILNKVDLLDEEEKYAQVKNLPHCVATSTLTGEGLKLMREKMAASLSPSLVVHLLLPHYEGELLPLLYSRGRVLENRPAEGGYYLVAEIPESLMYRLSKYAIEDGSHVDKIAENTEN